MRNIGLADKWRLSLVAILCLAGCSSQDSGAVAVKSRPQDGYDTIKDSYGCVATVVRHIPATRYMVDGSQQEYTIDGVIGYKDTCK